VVPQGVRPHRHVRHPADRPRPDGSEILREAAPRLRVPERGRALVPGASRGRARATHRPRPVDGRGPAPHGTRGLTDAAMALELTGGGGGGRGGTRRTQVVPKDVVFLGRREDNDVVLPYSFVSSRHGRVFRRDGSVFVEDMGSTNGIFVNGDALSPMVPR